MQEHTLTTVFYQYRSYAKGLIGLYVLLVFVTLGMAMDNPAFWWLFVPVLMGPPLIAAVRQRSVFNVRVWDERKLIFSSSFIQIGYARYPLSEIEAIGLHIMGFHGYKIRYFGNGPIGYSEQGDDNIFSFRVKGVVQTFEFYLRDYASYAALCSIMQEWKNSGKSFVVKERYQQEYIHKLVKTLQY